MTTKEIDRLTHPTPRNFQEGIPPVDIADAKRACAWIEQAGLSVLAAGGEWEEPFVSSDTDGTVVFEWFERPKIGRKLTVYMDHPTPTCLKVWGLNIENEMEETLLNSASDFVKAWRWRAGMLGKLL